MDINNSMLEKPEEFHKNLENKENHKKAKKSGIKSNNINKIEITCDKEPKSKYNINSEEFAIHIIDCDSCLKKLTGACFQRLPIFFSVCSQ